MGFYLHKAFRLGPVRLNLSTRGLGASAGLTGARVGNATGRPYVHAGRRGLYYRGRGIGWTAALILAALLGLLIAWLAGAQPQRDPAGDRLLELAQRGLTARAPAWRCDVSARFICSISGCERGTGWAVWLLLDFTASRYERCDAKGCDAYELQHWASGVYTTASPGAYRGHYLKVLNDGSEFVESASLGTTAVTSFGRCAPTR